MTQDEIIRMAREAGIIHAHDTDGQWDGITDQQLLGYPYANPRSQEWAEKRIVEILEPFAALVAAHEREKPVTVPANGLRQQEPSRSTPTGSQSNEIVPVGYVDAMFRFQTCQEHYVSPSDRFKPVYTAKQIEAAVLAEREACAKVCDEGTGEAVQKTTLEILLNERKRIAKTIRDRGDA